MIKIYIDIQMLHRDGKVFDSAIELLNKWQAKGYEIIIEKDDQPVPKAIKKFKPVKSCKSLRGLDFIIAKNAVGSQIATDNWWGYFSHFDLERMLKNRTKNEVENHGIVDEQTE